MIDEENFSFTLGLIICYLIFSSLFAVCAAFYLFFARFDAQNFIITGAILLACLLIFGVVALLKCLIVFIHKKFKARRSTLLRNQIVIGLSGMTLCGILPRILAFFVNPVAWFHLSGLLSCVTSVALYFLLVLECDKRYEWAMKKQDKLFCIIGALHFVALIVTVKIVFIFNSDEDTIKMISVYQVISTFIGFPTIIDLYGILSGERKFKDAEKKKKRNRNAGNVRLESIKVVPKAEKVPRLECKNCTKRELQAAQTNPKIECKICLLEYSDVLIPRILNGCGHTICEKCAGTLLKKNGGKSLLCPFCQELTAVKGRASLLHKNYKILDIANRMKN